MRNPFKNLILECDASIRKEINEHLMLKLENKILTEIRDKSNANLWNAEIDLGDPCLRQWKSFYPVTKEDKSIFASQFINYCKENTMMTVNFEFKIEPHPGHNGTWEVYRILGSLTKSQGLEN